MERVVFKVEVDDALSDAVVFGRVLHNRLQEVCLEVEDVTIVFQPLGGDSWDGVVLLHGAPGYTREVGRGASLHRLENGRIGWLRQSRSFF